MEITLNGQRREVPLQPSAGRDGVAAGQAVTVAVLLAALEMKPDRIAVEQNGEIVRRAAWPTTPVREGDRFEIVHFVGGGL